MPIVRTPVLHLSVRIQGLKVKRLLPMLLALIRLDLLGLGLDLGPADMM